MTKEEIEVGDTVEIVSPTKTMSAGGHHKVRYSKGGTTEINYHGTSIHTDTSNVKLIKKAD